jgi:hypothetical protein
MSKEDRTIKFFSVFHKLRLATAKTIREKLLKHDQYRQQKQFYGLGSMVFCEMSRDFTHGLVSELNRFLVNAHHADCWVRAANSYPENEKAGFLWEFADPFLELSVGRAYSIKNYFAFAAVHLLNQANVHDKKAKDNLPPDRGITFEFLVKSKMGDGWKAYPLFFETLSKLNDRTFLEATRNYRNLVQHRFRPHFHTGLTTFFDRVVENGQVSYTYKAMRPMKLETVIAELYRQHEIASEAFQAYWNLTEELSVGFTKKPTSKDSKIVIQP